MLAKSAQIIVLHNIKLNCFPVETIFASDEQHIGCLCAVFIVSIYSYNLSRDSWSRPITIPPQTLYTNCNKILAITRYSQSTSKSCCCVPQYIGESFLSELMFFFFLSFPRLRNNSFLTVLLPIKFPFLNSLSLLCPCYPTLLRFPPVSHPPRRHLVLPVDVRE